MIRRKIWATATFSLAIAAAAQAQHPMASPANLGTPAAPAARGAVPNPGYPVYVPRNYVAPTPPTYAAPVANLNQTAPIELFAVDADTPPAIPGKPVVPAPMTPGAVTPMPMTPGSATPMPGTIIEGPSAGAPMMLNGGPMPEGAYIENAPFLSGMGIYGDGAMPKLWMSVEYLAWKLKGIEAPPLATTAAAGFPGTLDDGNTFILYGGTKDLLRDWQSGFRVRMGMWFPDGQGGLDLGFFSIFNADEQFNFIADGNQGLFRPFTNTLLRTQDAQLVSFTDPVAGPLLAGRIGTDVETNFWGAEINYRSGFGMGLGGRLDALVGYRYLSLQDKVTITTNSTTLVGLGGAPAGTLVTIQDQFETTNSFNGAQVGFASEWQIGQMTFGLRGLLGLGVNSQNTQITGTTNANPPGGTSVLSSGGLLALPTNGGSDDRNRWSIVPEIGVTLGYQVTNNVRVFAGYNLLCWSNVVRAGEQINTNVNPTYIADPITGVRTPTGAPAPTFHFRDDWFYAQGCSFGLECRW